MSFERWVVRSDEIMNEGEEGHVRVGRRIMGVIRERKIPVLSLYAEP